MKMIVYAHKSKISEKNITSLELDLKKINISDKNTTVHEEKLFDTKIIFMTITILNSPATI